MMKLLLSSHSLFNKDTKKSKNEADSEAEERKATERDTEGKKDDKSEREIKRVLIQLGKIYDPMRMWL